LANSSEYYYFWQETYWKELTNSNSNILNIKGGVILLTGPRGSGKSFFAKGLSKWLLCNNLNTQNNKSDINHPCGNCDSCLWLDANSHPDYYDVNENHIDNNNKNNNKKNITKNTNIKIDQIRELNDFLSLQPTLSRPKVIVINNIDKLTEAVANALLKPLESYPVYSILIADNFDNIIPTIKSRAQHWDMKINYDNKMKNWLLDNLDEKYKSNMDLYWIISGRAPLALLDAHKSGKLDDQYWLVKELLNLKDPWVCIDKWLSESLPLIWVLDAMYYILLEALKLKVVLNNINNINNINFISDNILLNLLKDFANKHSSKTIDKMLVNIDNFKKGFLNPASIHDDLMLEGVFIDWSSCFVADYMRI
jgi:DNA polymerase III subunit delta'